MSKKILRLGCIRATYPWISDCVLNDLYSTNCKKPGILVEIMKYLANMLNYEIEVIKTEDYGNCEKGSCTGLINLVANGTLDGTLHTFFYSESRLQGIQFVGPFGEESLGYIIGPHFIDFMTNNESWKIYLVFSKTILITLALFHIISASFRLLLKAKYGRIGNSDKRMLVLDAIWSQMSFPMMRVKQEFHPLTVSWILISAFLCFIYYGSFRGYAVIKTLPRLPFSNTNELAELVDRGRFIPITPHVSIVVDLALLFKKESPLKNVISVPNKEQIKRMLCNREAQPPFVNLDYISTQQTYFDGKPCTLIGIPEPRAAQQVFGFIFQKNSKIADEAQQLLLTIFSYDNWRRWIFHKYQTTTISKMNGKIKRPAKPFGIDVLIKPFIALICSYCAGICLFIVERYRGHRSEQYWI